MARRVLKERVFAPSGNRLGTFKAIELETFDIEYEESDEEGGEGGQSAPQSNSSVPKPKDDNPLKPEKKDDEEDKKNQKGNSSGSGDDSEEEDDEPYTGELDPYGNDLDDEEPLPPDTGNEKEGNSGGGSGNSIESDDEGDSGEDSDGSEGSGGGDSDDIDGEDGSGGSGDGDGEDTEDDTKDSRSSGSSKKDKSSDDSDNEEDSDGSDGGDSQSGDGSGNGKGDSGDVDFDDDGWDPREDVNDSGMSDLQKALQDLEDGETDVDKERRDAEDNNETTEGGMSEREKAPEREKATIDKDEQRAIKDALGKAIKDANKSKREMDDQYSETEDAMLKAMGAGSITTLFNPATASDWRRNLERVLDNALGFDIYTNPNLINKKIEDAPPGREDDLPQIKNILVMLDCSGSMGAREFVQVIDHLDTMMRVRNMGKVNFHIIDWGDSNVNAVAKTYVKVKGVRFKQEIRTHKDHGWGTQLIPGLLVASQKVHNPEAIIIMTDADIFDSDRLTRTEEGKIAAQYLKKHRKKIIWALTANGRKDIVDKFDPTAKSMGRIIKFKKSRT